MKINERSLREILILSMSVILLSLMLYKDFVFGDYLYVYNDTNDDTFQSYLSIYQFVVNKILNGEISLYDMSFGIGANILTAANIIFDPFAIILYIIGVIYGIGKIAYALIYVQILRMLCASLAIRFFLKSFYFSFKSIYIASIIYSFSAFMVGNIGQHYMFSSATVFIALLLGILERGRKNCKFYFVFSILVACLAIWNVYFCYMLLLPSCIYLLLRWLQEEELTLKSFLRFNLPWYISIACGILASMVILLPTIIIMLSTSNRISGGDNTVVERILLSCKWLPWKQYKSLFLSMFSNQLEGSLNRWEGADIAFKSSVLFCSAILPIGIIIYLKDIIITKRDRKKNVVLFFSFAVILLTATQILGTIFNAGVEYTSRYIFVLMPVFSYIIAFLSDKIFDKDISDVIVAIPAVLLFSFFILNGYARGQNIARYSAFISIGIMGIVILIMIAINLCKINRSVLFLMYLISVLSSVWIDNYLFTVVERNLITKEWYDENYINESMHQVLIRVDEQDDGFWRIERNFFGYGVQQAFTYANVERYRGVSFYNSLVNKGLQDFRSNMLNIPLPGIAAGYSFNGLGLAFDTITADILGLKYIVSDYSTANKEWELVQEISGKKVYKNKSLNTAGVLFKSWYSTDDFKEFNDLEKMAVLSQGAVCNDNIKGVEQCRVPPKLQVIDMIEVKNIEIVSGRVNKISKRSFDVQNEGIESSYILPVNMNENLSELNQAWLTMKVRAENSGTLSIYVDTGSGFYDLYWAQQKTFLDEDEEKEIIMKLPLDIQKIKIAYDANGKISFGDIIIYGESVRGYDGKGVELFNDKKDGMVFGTVNSESGGLLVIPVCNELGWKASVDGESVHIKTVDFAFIGLEIPPGMHEISLNYETPGLKVGLVCTVIGMVGIILLSLWSYRQSTN